MKVTRRFIVLRRFAGISLNQSFSTFYSRPLIGCFVGGIIPFVALRFILLNSWVDFLGAEILGCALVGAGGYALTLQREQCRNCGIE